MIIMYTHHQWDYKIILVLVSCFIVGMVMEIWGVHSGEVFGEYEYGDVLGPKLINTPYVIGLNWMMLIYCAGVTVNQLTKTSDSIYYNILFKSFLGALLMLSLDVLIEPVAIILGFWSWGTDGNIPMQNYVAWFLISFILLIVFNLFMKDLKNKAAFTLFILQFVFFALLGINWH